MAVAVSGGPDSMALALLSSHWVRSRGGEAIALIVDHGIRAESAAEAAEAAAGLSVRGIASRILPVTGLCRGPALAERARQARYAALIEGCRKAGLLHLLLGHHAGDQAETLMIRALSGSGAAGFAGMPALTELTSVRLLRPLLGIPPGRLRATLREFGMDWAEDPSNTDRASLRVRLRLGLGDPDGVGAGVAALVDAAQRAGQARAETSADLAAELAAICRVHAEGFIVLNADRLSAGALTAIIRTISGADFPPSPGPVGQLAANLQPATLGGVRIMLAGRLGPGFLIVREAAAMQAPVAAIPGAIWDHRFRLGHQAQPAPNTQLGALGPDAARLRDLSPLPAVILQTLPAIRDQGRLVAVPHLGQPDEIICDRYPMILNPSVPLAGAPFGIAHTTERPP